MKINKFFILLSGFAFMVTSSTGELSLSKKSKTLKNNISNVILRLNNSSSENNDEPVNIFSEAIREYQTAFSNYINVTALNVFDKENVTLPDFDINYTAPTFGEVMFNYQSDLENSLTDSQLEKYELLRQKDYLFDRYVALNNEKHLNSNPTLKYKHELKPSVVINPITPSFPDINRNNSYVTRSSDSTAEIINILVGAGIAQVAIDAFSASISTLTTALSTSWIPYIGWILAAGLALGALIALTVIIVQYWDEICLVMNDIKSWFLEQFNSFTEQINSFFADAVKQGEKSKIAGREKIGDIDLTWVSKVIKAGTEAVYLDALRRVKDLVVVMRHVKKIYEISTNNYYISYWGHDGLIPADFVVDNNVYDTGISTYTWYNDKARQLMLNGATLLEDNYVNELGKPYKIGYHNFLKTESHTINGFNHYHVFDYQKKKDGTFGYEAIKKGKIADAHSFFGLMYLKNPDGSFETYPKNP